MKANLDILRIRNLPEIVSPYKLAHLRHRATTKLLEESPGQFGELRAAITDRGLLSPKEIEACLELRTPLPDPFIQRCWGELPRRFRTDNFDQIAIHLEEENNKAIVLSGVFDVVHYGHLKFVIEAVRKAMEMKNARVFIIVESDKYSLERKGKLPIFSEFTRAGWFREILPQFPRLNIGVYPHDQTVFQMIPNAFESLFYEDGLELLADCLPLEKCENVLVVVPEPTDLMSKEDRDMATLQIRQRMNFGFNVLKVPSTLGDVHSSDLRTKFNLQPVSRVSRFVPSWS